MPLTAESYICLPDIEKAPQKRAKEKQLSFESCFIWRYRPDLNWGIKVLQTFALPLGHGTI